VITLIQVSIEESQASAARASIVTRDCHGRHWPLLSQSQASTALASIVTLAADDRASVGPRPSVPSVNHSGKHCHPTPARWSPRCSTCHKRQPLGQALLFVRSVPIPSVNRSGKHCQSQTTTAWAGWAGIATPWRDAGNRLGDASVRPSQTAWAGIATRVDDPVGVPNVNRLGRYLPQSLTAWAGSATYDRHAPCVPRSPKRQPLGQALLHDFGIGLYGGHKESQASTAWAGIATSETCPPSR
jgi:hypothetical protein